MSAGIFIGVVLNIDVNTIGENGIFAMWNLPIFVHSMFSTYLGFDFVNQHFIVFSIHILYIFCEIYTNAFYFGSD